MGKKFKDLSLSQQQFIQHMYLEEGLCLGAQHEKVENLTAGSETMSFEDAINALDEKNNELTIDR